MVLVYSESTESQQMQSLKRKRYKQSFERWLSLNSTELQQMQSLERKR